MKNAHSRVEKRSDWPRVLESPVSFALLFQLWNGGWFFQLWKYDKVVHFVEYLGVGFLLINALKIQPLRKSHWKFALLFLFIFPVIDEVLQYFIPRRIPDIFDGVADVIGGLTGAYLRKIF